MIVVEPSDVYGDRERERLRQITDLLRAPLRDKTGWDDTILWFLRQHGTQPVLLMRVVNPVARQRRAASTRHWDAMRREVINAIGSLIRRGKVLRFKRRFVLLPPKRLPAQP